LNVVEVNVWLMVVLEETHVASVRTVPVASMKWLADVATEV
jgi:hypothetical protein